MMDRRGLIAGGVAVERSGKVLGSHNLSFRRNGDVLTVDVLVELTYKVGPVTLFHYNLHVNERWAGGEVVAMDSQTNDNGTKYRVSARREGGAFMVEGNAVPRYAAPANALPATHWNRHELDGPWINPQDGKILRPAASARGIESVATANGAMRARRYALSGAVKMDLWYDDDGVWSGLAFVKSGAEVRYLRK
jgi:hypothetical protein